MWVSLLTVLLIKGRTQSPTDACDFESKRRLRSPMRPAIRHKAMRAHISTFDGLTYRPALASNPLPWWEKLTMDVSLWVRFTATERRERGAAHRVLIEPSLDDPCTVLWVLACFNP